MTSFNPDFTGRVVFDIIRPNGSQKKSVRVRNDIAQSRSDYNGYSAAIRDAMVGVFPATCTINILGYIPIGGTEIIPLDTGPGTGTNTAIAITADTADYIGYETNGRGDDGGKMCDYFYGLPSGTPNKKGQIAGTDLDTGLQAWRTTITRSATIAAADGQPASIKSYVSVVENKELLRKARRS